MNDYISKLKPFANLLVAAQFGLLALFIFSGPVICKNVLLLSWQAGGCLLIFWSVVTMRLNNLSISPLLKESVRLTTNGPYQFIRHPMYTSILLVVIPAIIESYSLVRLVLLLLLFTVLLAKALLEESLLQERFPVYTTYMGSTKRFIPFLF